MNSWAPSFRHLRRINKIKHRVELHGISNKISSQPVTHSKTLHLVSDKIHHDSTRMRYRSTTKLQIYICRFQQIVHILSCLRLFIAQSTMNLGMILNGLYSFSKLLFICCVLCFLSYPLASVTTELEL